MFTKRVKPERVENNRDALREILVASRRTASGDACTHFAQLPRFLATIARCEAPYICLAGIANAARPCRYSLSLAPMTSCFGLLQSRFHEVWALKQGTRLETRPRYTPTTCFETFPFPRPTPAQEAAIAAAAKELNELRERWLNPPEWTAHGIPGIPRQRRRPVGVYYSRHVAAPTRMSRQNADMSAHRLRYPRLDRPKTPIAPPNSKSARSRIFTTNAPHGWIWRIKN